MPPKKRQQKKAAAAAKSKVEEPATNGASHELDEEMSLTAKFAAMKAHHRSVVGSLQSRLDSRDIKIENITLTFHGKELLTDATLELNYGNRYGLIGPNGSGKSTILETIALRELPIPPQIDIFHLNGEVAPTNTTALETVVSEVEREIKRLEAEAERVLTEEGPESSYLLELYDRIDSKDPQTLTARAAEILHGLGFSPQRMNAPTKDLSGGWRMRVALARALFVKPTLLLLDEPTNHLDIAACVWLEEYLKDYESTVLLISHSQDFLNHVCTNTINLRRGKLMYYGGNYDTFIKTKAELDANQMKAYQKQQDDIKHIKEFIASCGTYSNLVRQGKSKQKIIDKMVAAGLTEAVVSEPVFNFKFPSVEPLPPPVLAFQDVAFTYSGDMKHALYQHLNLGVTMDSRIALVGPNGAGKSTLLKLMVGELNPTQGVIRRHLNLNIGKYNQHSNEQLDQTATPLDFIRSKFDDRKLNEEEWRQHLGKYGVRGAQQTSPIGKMSDGQKSRLVFCLMSVTRPNFICLDEPTNHLDIECIDSLADAIRVYEGAVVLVSHDFRLIDQIAKEIWVCDEKTVTRWKGSIRDYKKSLMKKMGLAY